MSSYRQVVITYLVVITVVAVVIGWFLFSWSPAIGWIWVTLVLTAAVYAGVASVKGFGTNEMMVVYESDSLTHVYVNKTFLKTEIAQDWIKKGRRLDITSFLGLPNKVARLAPFYYLQKIPIEVLEIPLDIVWCITKGDVRTVSKSEEEGTEKIYPSGGVILDPTLFVRFPPTERGIAELVTGLNLRDFGDDLTKKEALTYLGWDEKEGATEKRIDSLCLSVYLKKTLQNTLHSTIRETVGEFSFGKVGLNTTDFIEELNRKMMASKIIKQIGFDHAGETTMCQLVIEHIITEADSPTFASLKAVFAADARAEEGRGQAEYLAQISETAKIDPRDNLMIEAIKHGNVSIVATEGSILDAAYAKMQSWKGNKNVD